MAENVRHTINMANSVIGVSILSMSYCFKETGLALGIILLLFSGFITKKTCIFIIQSAIMSRRRSYELLAFQVFGITGKLLIEICIILFLMGICISFHVVIGDLTPAMVAKYMAIENTPPLRATILMGMVFFVILPLCFFRNLESLASMSACSIGFYVFLNGVIFAAAFSRLLDGSWITHAVMFKFENALKVLPIMTLSLSCQSNVFEIYYSIPEPDLVKMRSVVSHAVNLCCALYTGVGFLGYVAFIGTDMGGNILTNLPNSAMMDGIKIFFVVSLAMSFPLILFPCRTSIHSLLYKRNIATYDIALNFIPEYRFKLITISVLLLSLLIGILLPDIEFVLGLLGSTMGMLIALIFPSIFFIKVYTKQSLDRLLAQGILLLGIFLMVTGTALHLSGVTFGQEELLVQSADKQFNEPLKLPSLVNAPDLTVRKEIDNMDLKDPVVFPEIKVSPDETGRKEPVIPEPPLSNSDQMEIIRKDEIKNLLSSLKPPLKVEEEKVSNEGVELKPRGNKIENLNPDAIAKEEKEHAEEVKKDGLKKDFEHQQEKILQQMESQQKEQKLLIEAQKKILQELQQVQVEAVNRNVPEAVVEAKEPLVVEKDQMVVAKDQMIVAKEPLVVAKEPLVVAKEPLIEAKKPLVVNEKMLVGETYIKENPESVNQLNKDVARKVSLGAPKVPGDEMQVKNQIPILEQGAEKQLSKPDDQRINQMVQRTEILKKLSSLNQIGNHAWSPGKIGNLVMPLDKRDDVALSPDKIGNQDLPLVKPDNRGLSHGKPHKLAFPLGQHDDAALSPGRLDNQALPFGKHDVVLSQGKVVAEDGAGRHDEERRRRDLRDIEIENVANNMPSQQLSFNQYDLNNNIDRLLYPGELRNGDGNIKQEVRNELVNFKVYDSRHLLGIFSSKRTDNKIGRRKRKQKSPDYWDEM